MTSMPTIRRGVLSAVAVAAGSLWAAPAPVPVPLPNAGFEQAGQGRVDSFSKAGAVAPANAALVGLPDGWSAYQWGAPQESRFSVAVEKGAGHAGAAGLRLENLDATAKGGVYTHPRLEPGTYQLAIWARTETGKTARVALYLANAYSPPLKVTETWSRLVFENVVDQPSERAEINVQNASGEPSIVWVDDAELLRLRTHRLELVPDTRPERPRTLLFSPINISFLRDTAKAWSERGLRGFLFDQVMSSWSSDVWAADGDASTRGEDDALFRELKACNEACRQVGIDANFVKVAFYSELPDWFDDAAWGTLTENFRQGTRFARLAGCAGMAIDTEYIAQQYHYGWEGYTKAPRPRAELAAMARERLRGVVKTMLAEFPDQVLLTLPEGMVYYGPLYTEIFRGMLQACADADAPNGLHVLTEGTYHMTAPAALGRYPARLEALIAQEFPAPLAQYWRRRCSVAMGAWPLGYYRAINDANGKFLGWAGKQETTGDTIIGSYADKSAWYAPAVFAEQMAGLNTFCPRFNWIYGHGCVLWQWSEAEQQKYAQSPHQAVSNAALPTVTNLQAYLDILAKPRLAREVSAEAAAP